MSSISVQVKGECNNDGCPGRGYIGLQCGCGVGRYVAQQTYTYTTKSTIKPVVVQLYGDCNTGDCPGRGRYGKQCGCGAGTYR